jgi:hypothetical protein
MTCAQGAMARMYVEPGAAPHTFDSSSETYEFLYENLQKHGRQIAANGIRGTRSAPSERVAVGAYEVRGRVAMNVSPLDLDLWLPRILGEAENANVFALAETLPSFGVLMDRVTETFEYTDCVVDRALFHGKAREGDDEPDLLELALDIVGTTEVLGTNAPVVALGSAAGNGVYTMSQSVFTLASGTRQVKEFWLFIDNHIQQRWASGSTTATALCPRDRTVGLRLRVPFDETALYEVANSGLLSCTLAITLQSGISTTFNFGALQAPANSPVVRGKTEIDLIVDFTARSVGVTRELSITNDSA